jgi:hypothetical protein
MPNGRQITLTNACRQKWNGIFAGLRLAAASRASAQADKEKGGRKRKEEEGRGRRKEEGGSARERNELKKTVD